MLIPKLRCPYGCPTENAVFTESRKTIPVANSYLLLEGNKTSTLPAVQTIKVYTCHCCGNTFETYQPNSDGRQVL